jgi:co-chaperonin GroES (HSP10)
MEPPTPYDRIVVQRIEKRNHACGIVIPDSEEAQEGEVIAVGHGRG